ncbi:MAG: hypothetical protein N2234_09555 [Planctomycetota bacterium]|nr:hypothetical protein [Planctomycetota bacterium]
MKHSVKTGLCFGLTSATITTLGLMVGLHSGTGEKLAVIGGVLTIAIADAFSDALGIHMCEESENVHSGKEVWEATVATFFAKFFFALTFAVPVFLFELSTAVIVSILWGLTILALLSYAVARQQQKVKAWKVIAEHLGVAVAVITLAHLVGDCIKDVFGN